VELCGGGSDLGDACSSRGALGEGGGVESVKLDDLVGDSPSPSAAAAVAMRRTLRVRAVAVFVCCMSPPRSCTVYVPLWMTSVVDAAPLA
jgi:hypothetical protein